MQPWVRLAGRANAQQATAGQGPSPRCSYDEAHLCKHQLQQASHHSAGADVGLYVAITVVQAMVALFSRVYSWELVLVDGMHTTSHTQATHPGILLWFTTIPALAS